MLKYVDLIMDVDASYTREILDWEPTPRFGILRRSLFLLEKMKSHPGVWHMRNEVALKSVTKRINLINLAPSVCAEPAPCQACI